MQHGTEAVNDNNQPHIVLFQEELEDSVSCKAANVLSRWHRFTTSTLLRWQQVSCYVVKMAHLLRGSNIKYMNTSLKGHVLSFIYMDLPLQCIHYYTV